MFELETPYENHGVTVTQNSVRTPLGEVIIPTRLRMLMILLLESYPRAISYQTLSMAYDDFITSRTDAPLKSFQVGLAIVRKELLAIGIRVPATWGFGFRLELDI